MNSIHWTKRALRQLRKVDAGARGEVINAVDSLALMPKVMQVQALVRHQYGYRLRVGDFRVLFDWDGTNHMVEIQEVKKRDEQTY